MVPFKTTGLMLFAGLGLSVVYAWPVPADVAAGCDDPSIYGQNLEELGKCYGAGFYYEDVQFGRVRSGRSYVTCLDESLKENLDKEPRPAREAFAAYCKQFEVELGLKSRNYLGEVPRVADSIASILVSREWVPFFAEYLMDDHGYPRGHFSDDLWPQVKAEIGTTLDVQTFLDNHLSILMLGTREEELTPVYVEPLEKDERERIPDYWTWKSILQVRLRNDLGDIVRNFEMPVSLDLTFEPTAASDTNPLGVIAIDRNWEPGILTDVIEDVADTVRN